MDNEFNLVDIVPKLAVGLVLVTMGVLVILAVLSFMGSDSPLDTKPADVIKAAADAAAGGDGA